MASPLGLDQPFPARSAEELSRAFSVLDAKALVIVKRVLVPAIDTGDPRRVESALREVESELAGTGESLSGDTRKIGERVNRNHRTLFFEGVRLALGPNFEVIGNDQGRAELPSLGAEVMSQAEKTIVIVRPNPDPALFLDLFVDQNVQLVTTLEEGITDALRDQVSREVILGSGDPAELRERLLRQWEKRGVPSQIPTKRVTKAGRVMTVSARSHADLIARDQIAKLQGQLTRTRQMAAGITHFVWKDKDDSRVRPDHAALDGRAFSWAEGAPGAGIPGEPVSCRCHAEAVMAPASLLQGTGFEVVGP